MSILPPMISIGRLRRNAMRAWIQTDRLTGLGPAGGGRGPHDYSRLSRTRHLHMEDEERDANDQDHGSADQLGRKKGERDGRVDMTDAASLAQINLLSVKQRCRRAMQLFREDPCDHFRLLLGLSQVGP